MHDYARGAYEALSWVRFLIRRQMKKSRKGAPKELQSILSEVERAIDDICDGVAVDFRRKLTPIY